MLQIWNERSLVSYLSYGRAFGRRNGYYIETMNHDENEHLLSTSIISGQKCILEQLPSFSCGLY